MITPVGSFATDDSGVCCGSTTCSVSQTRLRQTRLQFVVLMPIRITLWVATWALHGRVSSDSASKQREAVCCGSTMCSVCHGNTACGVSSDSAPLDSALRLPKALGLPQTIMATRLTRLRSASATLGLVVGDGRSSAKLIGRIAQLCQGGGARDTEICSVSEAPASRPRAATSAAFPQAEHEQGTAQHQHRG